VRSLFATIRQLVLPAGSGPTASRIVLGPDVPAELQAFYFNEITAAILSYGAGSGNNYQYRALYEPIAGFPVIVEGFGLGGTIYEVSYLSGGTSNRQLFWGSANGTNGRLQIIIGNGVRAASAADEYFRIKQSMTVIFDAGTAITYDGESIVAAQAWTPSWTQAVDAGRALGNGTVVGRYLKQGNMCWVYIRLQIGSTTTFGTGNFLFDLPFNPGLNLQVLNGYINDTSVATGKWTASARIVTATNNIDAIFAGSALGPVTQAVPMTWANGDTLVLTGHYQTT
jgi:hypothetical protein